MNRQPRLLGYARVSTDEQHLSLQLDALEEVGCDRIYCDDGIGACAPNKPQFKSVMRSLRRGDKLVLWRLDRAFRSVYDAALALKTFDERGISFMVTTEAIDTSTPSGRFCFFMTCANAEYERMVISMRTKAGMKAARKRGSIMGRPKLLTPLQKTKIRREFDEGTDKSVLAQKYHVSPRTITRALASA